jgi:hypothetical protein
MAWVVFLILIGVAMIDGKLWKMLIEQRRHNQAMEILAKDTLTEIRAMENLVHRVGQPTSS